MNELILAGIALKERTKDGEIENFYEFTWYVDRKIHKVVLNDLPKELQNAWIDLQKSISNYLNFEKSSFDLQSFKITQKAKKAKDAEGKVYEELSWFFNYVGIVTKANLETQKVSFAKPKEINSNLFFDDHGDQNLLNLIVDFDAVAVASEQNLLNSIVFFNTAASEFITQKLNFKIN